LKGQHLDFLNEEARKVHPVEACAILLGKVSSDEAHVTRILMVPNKLNSTTRFEIDPEFVLEALNEAERLGLELVGFFHSHPAPTRPSPTDLRYMKLWGETIWLILSTIKGDIAASQMINGEIMETPVVVDCDN
jgi:proteasome lid subunit RPN8/RPN11